MVCAAVQGFSTKIKRVMAENRFPGVCVGKEQSMDRRKKSLGSLKSRHVECRVGKVHELPGMDFRIQSPPLLEYTQSFKRNLERTERYCRR